MDKVTVWVLLDPENDLWRPTTCTSWKRAVEFVQYKVEGRPFMLQKDTDRELTEMDFHAEAILDGENVPSDPDSAQSE